MTGTDGTNGSTALRTVTSDDGRDLLVEEYRTDGVNGDGDDGGDVPADRDVVAAVAVCTGRLVRPVDVAFCPRNDPGHVETTATMVRGDDSVYTFPDPDSGVGCPERTVRGGESFDLSDRLSAQVLSFDGVVTGVLVEHERADETETVVYATEAARERRIGTDVAASPLDAAVREARHDPDDVSVYGPGTTSQSVSFFDTLGVSSDTDQSGTASGF